MWRNYLTVGVRSLMKNRVYAIINILGLAIGMAACLMLLLFVRYELSYDADLPGAENAYQFQTYYTDRETGQANDLQMAAYVSKGALTKDFPQIEKVVYALGTGPVALRNGQAYEVENAAYTDGDLLSILQFPLIQGDPKTALSQPNQVVLTQAEAQRLFGTDNVMGKTLTLVSRGKSMDFRVTGIMKTLAKNSHANWPLIARIDMQAFNAEQPQFLTQWGWQSGWMYVKLRPGANAADINSQMHAWEKRNIPTETFGDQTYNQGDDSEYALVNIRDIHLGKAQRGSMTPGNDRRSIVTFAVVAALILGMACVNFVNLATARASQRAREVALRKVLGASRQQLIGQFMFESVLIAGLSMLVALAMVEIAIGPVAAFLKADLTMHYLGSGGLLLPVIGLTVLVGLAGGVYPSLVLSRFQPAKVLKANKSAADADGSGRLRGALVVAQFAVSIGLIICTAVVYSQTVYARTVNPGYNRDGLIQIEAIGRRQAWPMIDTLMNELKRTDGIVSAGRSTIGIDTKNNTNNGVQLPGRKDPVSVGTYVIDTGFLQTMGVKLVAGRLFDINRPMDDATTPYPEDPEAERALVKRGINVVANQLAVKRMGFKSAQDAVGKQIKLSVSPEYGGVMPATIIGVVEDSRFRSVRDPLDPILFQYARTAHNALLIRYQGDPAAARAKVETLWKRLLPEVPFDAKFSEDIIGELYAAEAARAQIFAAFAALAVIVGCLGLFGLAAFTADRRTKEIGIRKVLGARTRDIVQLLVWQFTRPVIIANLIAWPVAWLLMRDWLNRFDDRIGLGPTPFIAAGILALVIAIGTIAAHALKVASANPIRALRYE